MWQHRHYLALALIMNFGLPLLIGWASGDIVGVFLLAECCGSSSAIT
jgi:stearoyl-CoA desaturase (Delta-9 desaturase)